MGYLAKKRFGQNFLIDSHFVHQIIQSIPKLPIQCVEIGAGLGDLTQELLKIESLIAYEVDRDLCSLLCEKFSKFIESGQLQLINHNVLDFSAESAWLHSGAYKVVSNLPYYIATNIILRLLRDKYCQSFLVMTQKEVAQKFCAVSGHSEFCALSVLVESLGNAQMLFDVPPQAFKPMPKVISSVFVVNKYPTHKIAINTSGDTNFIWQDYFHISQLESFLKLAFSAPRKKLFKTLEKSFDKSRLTKAFEYADINPNARAHEVKTIGFHHLLAYLKA